MPGCCFRVPILSLQGLTSIIGGPSMLNALLGETLCVKCQYEAGYHNYDKYWCRGSIWSSCEKVISTSNTEEEKRVGKTAIKDNHTQLEFTVRMENITKEDVDIYWCGIRRPWASDFNWKVNITVTIELPTTNMTTAGYISSISTFPTESTQRNPNRVGLDDLQVPSSPGLSSEAASSASDLDLIIMLPVVLGLLMLILGGTTLLMWKLKKKKVTKNSKGPLPSTVSPSSDQATDGTEVAYTTVIPTRSFASKSQVSEKTEKVDYASFRFSTLNDQPIYANT
ncbi:CMRF35-like molecule 1 isoform X2 [Ahaetulla prasina]|uniref:CMRF35-like molecule 1 isoform X2 n=1 Tax=Ahaetulla prasina TaxID=499056 RepID=UPI002649322B|nr:CMRF35-like molecule 1 isoform X2 [Ahaetulla prasina]